MNTSKKSRRCIAPVVIGVVDNESVGEHLRTGQRVVTAADELTLHMARASGAVASFAPAARQQMFKL